ncbi:hypothetical protein Rt10032_c17g5788 [Rhodotorula toruloides]|uniref:Uncharacterized protein n=1 Tax=Rhodotorula toruloides TaxID=5286 RepID=A0A511KN41_RHOTO|nr:hypothetical protein Rt10032_c17g5788 [Rhodotorula toruloides]
MPAHNDEGTRAKRGDELVSQYIRLWEDVVDYGKTHRDAEAIARLLDDIRAKNSEVEGARQQDPRFERLTGFVFSWSGRAHDTYLLEDEDEQAEELGKKLDNADEVVDGLKEGMKGNLSAPASLSSASGAENTLAESHSRLGYRQTLRYFGVKY